MPKSDKDYKRSKKSDKQKANYDINGKFSQKSIRLKEKLMEKYKGGGGGISISSSMCLSFLLVVTLFTNSVNGYQSILKKQSKDFALSYPNPYNDKDGSLCNNYIDGDNSFIPPICDTSKLLSSFQTGGDDVEKITNKIKNLQSNTNIKICDGVDATGDDDTVEVAVVILKRMSHLTPSYIFPSENSDNYDSFILNAGKILAEDIHNNYGVGTSQPKSCISGSSGKDNGILIFLSIYDRVIHISIGGGLTQFLTTRRIQSIVDSAKPHLRKNLIGEGIVTTIDEIDYYLKLGPPSAREKIVGFIGDYWIFAGIFSVIAGVAYNGIKEERNRNDYNKAKHELTKLEKEKAEFLAGQYKCRSCPICLEDFTTKSNMGEEEVSSGSDGKPLMLLRCGHTFDETCFEDYMKSASGGDKCCPICRADLKSGKKKSTSANSYSYEEDSGGSNNANTNSSPPTGAQHRGSSHSHNSSRSYNNFYEPELRFRLNRLNRRYPRFITQRQVNAFSGHKVSSFTTDPHFVNMAPPIPTSSSHGSGGSRSSRSSGSSRSSFGGGSSGGGGGGRW